MEKTEAKQDTLGDREQGVNLHVLTPHGSAEQTRILMPDKERLAKGN